MIVLKMKGRDSYLSTFLEGHFSPTWHLGHVRTPKQAKKFKTWDDAVLGTKELFDGGISINDYEAVECTV